MVTSRIEAIKVFVHKETKFTPRSILTHEMLELMYEFPRRGLQLRYSEYGDGIITGLLFKEVDSEIHLTSGIVKVGEAFYFAEYESLNLSKLFKESKAVAVGEYFRFALHPASEVEQSPRGGVKDERLEIKLKLESANDPIHLGSVYDECPELKLPDINVDVEEFYGEFTDKSNKMYLLDIPYSCLSGATFHPYIFRAIKNILQRKQKKTPSDFLLLMQIEQTGMTTLETLKTYIESNGGKRLESPTREDIFKNLPEALKAVPNVSISFSQESSKEKNSSAQDEYNSLII